MKENKISVRILKPISEVFDFTINPNNTPKWIDFIVEEIATSPIQIGTSYVNTSVQGEKNEYVVSAFEINKIFELKSVNADLSVRYTYTEISPEETELEYFEWVENGELAAPFSQHELNKLKEVMEK
ncbi:MAG: hypothetical protein KA028_01080 [Candidatus Pacebacteria bacterium]|jgi:hypothetical protein|nr:hypothetical protein [Candidatus Paceibacterota bacterium]MBP9852113.1 hypothetical protein [Candidatus Paceibacterota bacterium]